MKQTIPWGHHTPFKRYHHITSPNLIGSSEFQLDTFMKNVSYVEELIQCHNAERPPLSKDRVDVEIHIDDRLVAGIQNVKLLSVSYQSITIEYNTDTEDGKLLNVLFNTASNIRVCPKYTHNTSNIETQENNPKVKIKSRFIVSGFIIKIKI